jgi:deoxyribodipyrimidine photo-lyase
MRPSLVWFRRDLRLIDHPALQAALESSDCVVPVFCFDRRLLRGRHRSGPRTQFMLECLRDVDRSLRERGSRLVVRDGPPALAIARLAKQIGADRVHATADVGPFARRRDDHVRHVLERGGANLELHAGLFAVDAPEEIATAAGSPYTIFTPFFRSWSRAPRRDPIRAPASLPQLPSQVRTGTIPTLEALGLKQAVPDPLSGGERAGRARTASFLDGGLERYDEERDMLDSGGTSALSPYLHFGCVSPRELEARLEGGGPGADEFRRQLGWRDFYAQLLAACPSNAHMEHRHRYRGTIKWSRGRRRFDAWCHGRTGYPLVDAAMRQLRREGWMHNRARLLVGSFLTKDLGIDWRWGERWFMRLLIDGDEASNNGNWQWIASVGTDPQPPARRIYNPTRQQERLDPRGVYVRRYVPELERVPDAYLAKPWTMPADVQEASGCVIGRNYPAPIVNHLEARRAAIARYAAAR